MKQLKKAIHYLYGKLTGSFIGFVIGMATTSLVSRYFETRSIKNLWGLTAKKRIVDKQTYAYLEWIISVIIGFVVFEIITKLIQKKLDEKWPLYKYKILVWIVKNGLHTKYKKSRIMFQAKTIILMAYIYQGSITVTNLARK
jgi:hypothetical protein